MLPQTADKLLAAVKNKFEYYRIARFSGINNLGGYW